MASTRQAFSIGAVLSSTFNVIGGQAVGYILCSVLFGALPSVLSEILSGRLGPLSTGPSPALLGQVIAIVPAAIGEAILIHIAYMHLAGRPTTLAQSLRTGLTQFLPLLLIGLMYGASLVLGFLFLLIPGLFLLARWAVVGAARVVEDRGVLASFSRSADLTADHRWASLLIQILLLVMAVILQEVARLLGSALASPLGISADVVAMTSSAFGAALALALRVAGETALYFLLRGGREGLDTQEMANVFD
jgi:hypothetical protein